MTDRLVICVLGKSDSGKSYTWKMLFGDTNKKFLKSGKKELRLRSDGCIDELVEVFLVYSSPEELDKPVGDIVGDQKCPIVLCSMQYANDENDDPYATLNYFIDRGFFLYVQWLNPGYRETDKIEDQLLVDKILSAQSVLSVRKVTKDDHGRVRELLEFIYGWAKNRKCRRGAGN